MRLPIAAVVLLAATLPSPARAAAADELGRLFLTPEQRSALDARRKARLPDKPAAAIVVESPLTRIDGVVTRGSGKSTVWVNGEPVPEGAQPDGMRVDPQRTDSGRVSVDRGETDSKVDLKIGQSVDRATGEVKDPLGGGEVKVHRAPAQKKNPGSR